MTVKGKMFRSRLRIERILWATMLLGLICVALPSVAEAADAVSLLFAQAPQAAPQTGVVRSSRTYYGEAFLVFLLFAAALGAVCKSSRRS